MKIKPLFITKTKDGKVELTPQEIENLILEAYNEGFKDGEEKGKNSTYIPPVIYNPLFSSTSGSGSTPTITTFNGAECNMFDGDLK